MDETEPKTAEEQIFFPTTQEQSRQVYADYLGNLLCSSLLDFSWQFILLKKT